MFTFACCSVLALVCLIYFHERLMPYTFGATECLDVLGRET